MGRKNRRKDYGTRTGSQVFRDKQRETDESIKRMRERQMGIEELAIKNHKQILRLVGL